MWYKLNEVKRIKRRYQATMKYIQASDIHFDMPFTTISNRANLGQQRRIDQREAF